MFTRRVVAGSTNAKKRKAGTEKAGRGFREESLRPLRAET